jgi:regulatory protein
MANNEVTPASIRMAAMNLLAMREHSAKELRVKLCKKFEQTNWVAAVVEKLQSDGLQSDDRFTAAYVAMRLRQGKGALAIRLDLKEKGISEVLISDYLLTSVDWNELALQAYRKKFVPKSTLDIKEKSKRIRFLVARGFSSANIQYALKYSLAEVD